MATQSWLDNFPNYCPISFISCKSDHSPTVLKLQNNLPFRRPRRFCFENSWLDEDELPHVVTTTLKNSLGNDIVSKLNNCAKELKLWELLGVEVFAGWKGASPSLSNRYELHPHMRFNSSTIALPF
ncbi:hypothetical protein JHK82_042833 [Glycine max]|nr:hypothetical protein JHK86_042849 [Glycine max]KAG4957095.1 hypothetical protein JHK85_043475 [Glycine max]KAG5105863.1 hypothetical protein JHK82_042833 [Glycine max]